MFNFYFYILNLHFIDTDVFFNEFLDFLICMDYLVNMVNNSHYLNLAYKPSVVRLNIYDDNSFEYYRFLRNLPFFTIDRFFVNYVDRLPMEFFVNYVNFL